MTRRWDEPHAGEQLELAVDRHVLHVGCLDPLADRVVVLAPRVVELLTLHVGRSAGEEMVATAVVEVQMRVDDDVHAGQVEVGLRAQGVEAWIHVGHRRVLVRRTGVHEHATFGVVDDVNVDRQPLPLGEEVRHEHRSHGRLGDLPRLPGMRRRAAVLGHGRHHGVAARRTRDRPASRRSASPRGRSEREVPAIRQGINCPRRATQNRRLADSGDADDGSRTGASHPELDRAVTAEQGVGDQLGCPEQRIPQGPQGGPGTRGGGVAAAPDPARRSWRGANIGPAGSRSSWPGRPTSDRHGERCRG